MTGKCAETDNLSDHVELSSATVTPDKHGVPSGNIAANNDCLDRLSSLAADYRAHGGYATIREEFIEVSSALNELSLTAPAFREQPRVPPKSKRVPGDTQLLIDQIVIDCHWLHCRGEQVRPRWRELGAHFNAGSAFDVEAVRERLAARNWSSEFRANELLSLTDRQQAQLLQVCGPEMRAKRAEIVSGSGYDADSGKRQRARPLVTGVRRAIYNWADVTHQVRGHEEMYEALWVARQLLPQGASNSQIAALAGLYCGRVPLSPRTVTDKLKQLDRVVAAAEVESRVATSKAQSKAASRAALARMVQSTLFGAASGASLAAEAALPAA